MISQVLLVMSRGICDISCAASILSRGLSDNPGLRSCQLCLGESVISQVLSVMSRGICDISGVVSNV